MKLYKYLVSAVLVGTLAGFSSCKNEEDDIFSASAAQRLDEYKKEYAEALTSNGGRWLMEYFANEDEEGYVFAMTFNKNGSVRMIGQNKWQSYVFVDDESLWDIIADDGPVLSFNSYNEVLHLFSTPENITGPYAPTNPDADPDDNDIDETGTGHGGDYEFVILGLSEDGQTMHLTGKKYLHHIYLHRLDADVNVFDLLAEYSAAPQLFDSRFNELSLWDRAKNEEFIISGLSTGIISAYPANGDFVTQTVKGNALLSPDGFRFMNPLEIECADAENSISVQTFKFDENGTLTCSENSDIYIRSRALSYEFTNVKKTWTIDLKDAGGQFATLIQAMKDGFNAQWKGKRDLSKMVLGFEPYEGVVTPYLNILANTTFSRYYMDVKAEGAEGVSIRYIDAKDSNGTTFMRYIPAIQEFLDLLSSASFELSAENILFPTKIKCVSKSNPDNYFYINLDSAK